MRSISKRSKLALLLLGAFGLGASCVVGGYYLKQILAGDGENPGADALREMYSGSQDEWPEPNVAPGREVEPLAALPPPDYPKDNPYSPEKEKLGEKLFSDPRLSASGQHACASCHAPELGWADGQQTSFGHDRQQGNMNAPTIVNAAYLDELFWDGRADSLEQQALASLSNPIEMAADPGSAAERIGKVGAYREKFRSLFGGGVTSQRIAKVLATFVRAQTMRNTPFDHFMRGQRNALDDQELRGLHVFRTKARCMNCHQGPNLTDGEFHHLGTSFWGVGNDEGRYAVTEKPDDFGTFRTAPLRNVVHTQPYMHNGLIPQLRSVLDLYNSGWWQNERPEEAEGDPRFPKLSPLIKPLNLNKSQVQALRAFMGALSTPKSRPDPPDLPEHPQ